MRLRCRRCRLCQGGEEGYDVLRRSANEAWLGLDLGAQNGTTLGQALSVGLLQVSVVFGLHCINLIHQSLVHFGQLWDLITLILFVCMSE